MSEQRYNITSSWTRQEYQIKTLRLETSRVTFRRGEKNVSGVTLPKTLTNMRELLRRIKVNT